MTFRTLYDRLYFEVNKLTPPTWRKHYNPFRLTSEDVRSKIVLHRFNEEDAEGQFVKFRSKEEGSRQSFLFYQRVYNNNQTLADLMRRMDKKDADKVVAILQSHFKEIKIDLKTSLKCLCYER